MEQNFSVAKGSGSVQKNAWYVRGACTLQVFRFSNKGSSRLSTASSTHLPLGSEFERVLIMANLLARFKTWAFSQKNDH